MKSIEIIPPISLKNICLTISLAADKLVSTAKSSCSPDSLLIDPLLTSITFIASVFSIIKYPPLSIETVLLDNNFNCLSTPL